MKDKEVKVLGEVTVARVEEFIDYSHKELGNKDVSRIDGFKIAAEQAKTMEEAVIFGAYIESVFNKLENPLSNILNALRAKKGEKGNG